MRHLTTWLDNCYCSITLANHQLITVIRFIAKSYTHLWKNFTNRFHLVLHAYEILFSRIVCWDFGMGSKQGHACNDGVPVRPWRLFGTGDASCCYYLRVPGIGEEQAIRMGLGRSTSSGIVLTSPEMVTPAGHASGGWSRLHNSSLGHCRGRHQRGRRDVTDRSS